MEDDFLITTGRNVISAQGLRQVTQSIDTNIRGRDIFRIEDTQNEARYRRLFDALYYALQEMFAVFQVSGEDTLSVTLEGRLEDDSEMVIGIPRYPWNQFNVDFILDFITRKLQSSQTLQGGFRLVWIHYPQISVQLAGNPFRGNWDTFVAKKQSFTPIHPPDDPYQNECFEQWIVLGLADYIRRFPEEKKTFPTVFNYLRLSKSTFKTLTQHLEKFKYRHHLVQRLKECIVHQPNQFSVLQELERQLNIRFCLFGFTMETQTFTLVYPSAQLLPYPDEKYTIFGICRGQDQGRFTHVDYIKNADAIELFPIHLKSSKQVSQGHVCRKCFQFYVQSNTCTHGKNEEERLKRKKENLTLKQIESCPKCHICVGCCKYCLQTGCERTQTVACPECNRKCHSFTCLQNHLQFACTKGFRKIMKKQPECPICGIEHEPDEGCFLKRTKLKEPSTAYAVYDFECCFDADQKHIPYCVTCCFPYGHPELKALQEQYPHRIVQEQVVFVFWGLHTEGFWDFLTDERLKKTIFYAHNGRAYDSILIKSYMWTRKKWISQDICRGRKFLQVDYPKFELTFRDSLCFIPTTLRSMSTDFGIEEFRKGHFPHRYMTVEHVEAIPEDGKIPRPAREYFDCDFRSDHERQEAEEWIDRFCAQSDCWDIRNDAIEYCISDTLLLGETLKRFRDQTMEMCSTIERAEDVEYADFDPFQYMTLASAMMSFYFSQCLPEQTIALIDRYQCLWESKARAWLHSMGKADVWNVQEREGVTFIGEDEQHYYAFFACEREGCTTCFPVRNQGQWHPRLQCTYEMARVRRERIQQELEKPLIFIWEHDYDESKMDPLWIGLDPRDAYKGGKTELYKLRVPGKCAMVDFVSQYPTVCFGESIDPLDCETERMMEWSLPIGQPNKMYRPTHYNWDQECLGIAKVWICPPQHCYAPFLSYRSTGAYGELEVCYGCCKICMDTHQQEECHHTPKERAFIGTWTLTELRYARTLGYEILEIVEVWEYPEKTNTLFRSFIVPFMYHKIVSKTGGCVDHQRTQFTEKGKQVAAYLQHIMNREILPQEFTDSPARRTVAKLIQNAFTGKWGQRDSFTSTRSFTEEESWSTLQILNDPNVHVQSAMIYGDQCVTLTYEKQRGAALHGLRKKNDHIVAHITAYGRLMLNRVEQALGKNLVYVDTDSAYHVQVPTPIYRTGFRTGDLELECPTLTNWVGLARKSYAYQTEKKVVVKQKGIAMRASLESSFAPEALEDLIHQTKRKMDETDPSLHNVKRFKSVQPSITVPQLQFRTEKNELNVHKETVCSEKETRLNVFSCKRKIMWDCIENGILDTLPYGYRSK